MHEAVLADVEIARAGAAVPFIRLAIGQILLKPVVVREVEHRLPERHNLFEDCSLRIIELQQAARSVVNDSDRCRETEIAARFAIVNASSGFLMPPPTTEFMVTSNSASSARHCSFWSSTFRLFFDTSSGHDVVDADLKMIEAGAIQTLDTVASQEIAIRDQRGDHATLADMVDDLVEVGMKQRLAPAQRHNAGAQCDKSIDAMTDVRRRDRRRTVVVLVTVGAREVTAPDGDEMCRDWPVAKAQRPHQHASLAESPIGSPKTPPQSKQVHDGNAAIFSHRYDIFGRAWRGRLIGAVETRNVSFVRQAVVSIRASRYAAITDQHTMACHRPVVGGGQRARDLAHEQVVGKTASNQGCGRDGRPSRSRTRCITSPGHATSRLQW